jgi:four helix bundle protein
MRLEELKVYIVAMDLGELAYNTSKNWNYFDKRTLGEQYVRAADSIAANISEGYGRYSFKETKVFLYYARGSAHETKTWITKATQRGLLAKGEVEQLGEKIELCISLLNGLIKVIGKIPSS